MKYEYNYLRGKRGFKIHGDITVKGTELRCGEPEERLFFRFH